MCDSLAQFFFAIVAVVLDLFGEGVAIPVENFLLGPIWNGVFGCVN